MGKIRIDRTHAGRAGKIIIDHPEKMNAMTVEMRQAYGRAVGELSDDPKVQVVVVQGAGNKAFSAGGDVAQFLKLAPHDLVAWGKEMETTEACPKPVIAAIDGFTLGAGFELALACDIRIATERSEFALPEVRLGMMPGSGGSQRLLRLIGPSRAKYWIMTGRRMGVAEAERLGIVSKVVPAGGLDAASETLPSLSRGPQADASGRGRCSARNRLGTRAQGLCLPPIHPRLRRRSAGLSRKAPPPF